MSFVYHLSKHLRAEIFPVYIFDASHYMLRQGRDTNMKKMISIFMIGSQLALTSAFAANSPAVTSPEFTMLENVMALQGQKLSDSARQAKIDKILGAYTASASKDEDARSARMQAALVQLGVYTPAQAEQFMSDAKVAELKVRATQAANADQTRPVFASEITKLANLHPAGAQYSMCDIAEWGGIIGVATAVVGLVLRYDNPTCHNDILGYGSSCYYDSYGNWMCGDTTVYGPTYCDRQDYYPNRSLGNGLLIGGGVAAAVGALVYFESAECN